MLARCGRPSVFLVDDADAASLRTHSAFDHKRQLADLDYLTSSENPHRFAGRAIRRGAARMIPKSGDRFSGKIILKRK